MEEEQLDLFQLGAGGATQFGARAAKIVWSDAGNSDFGRVLPEHMPDDLLAQVLAGNRARAVHGSEDVPSGNARRGSPPRAHRCLSEAVPRSPLRPGHKLVQGHVVDPLRDRRRHAVEHERLAK